MFHAECLSELQKAFFPSFTKIARTVTLLTKVTEMHTDSCPVLLSLSEKQCDYDADLKQQKPI